MKAYESGINHWDTADVYGDGRSEKIIGEMWETVPRNDIFIATKVGWDKGPHKNWYEKSHMVKNMNRSLKNLNSDYVDAIYLHHCNFGKEGEYFDEAFDTIKRFQSDGKAVPFSLYLNWPFCNYVCSITYVALRMNHILDSSTAFVVLP